MNNLNKFNQNQFLIPDVWNNYYIDINNQLLNYNILKTNLTLFWKEIIEKIGDKYVILLLRIEYHDGDIATLGNLHKININDFDVLLEIFKDILHFKNEGYKIREIKNIIFSYKIIPDDKLKNKSSKLISRSKNHNKTTYKFSGWNLPNTMDYNLFGKILSKNSKNIMIKDINNQYYYNIFIKKDHNEVNLLNTNKSVILKQQNLTQRNSIILPFILNILDINIPEGSENLTNYAFGVMILSLVALLCFINVLGYFISLYILDKFNIETRFPKLNKIKTYYQNTTIIFFIFESLFCILILLFLIISAYLYLKKVLITS